MNIKALEIRLGRQRIGVLFQYAPESAAVVNRFVADQPFIDDPGQATLSLSLRANTPQEQALLWQDLYSASFNGSLSKDGRSWLLPAFFQNLLPEGVFRVQLAQARKCDPDDHFELLAACGKDLPGNVYALPTELTRDELGHLVTQDADALEMTVSAEPMEQGVSLSGFQPKLGVIRHGDRYVGRTKDQDTHIIAKLPVMGYPLLPEAEDLSLRLARAAGVDACQAYLAPLSQLAAQHRYELGDVQGDTNFLAVPRYDRAPGGRVHCEDFAQVFGVTPENKYSPDYSYLGIGAVLLGQPSLGEPAVHELLRRIMVNELLGNPDMHMKNVGLWYPDGRTPMLPPAYDIVAHSIFTPNTGHGLRILPEDFEARLPRKGPVRTGKHQLMLSPIVLRIFCDALGIPERPAANTLVNCVKAAVAAWPQMIRQSLLSEGQKQKLIRHFQAHPQVAGMLHR